VSGFGIMFHHFWSQDHPKGQGAISAEQFDQMICWLKKRYSLLDIDEFQERVEKNQLKSREICLTFDDSLLCQSDVALPVLDSHGISALFNVYSSALTFTPKIPQLEIYRYYRTVSFENFESFFNEFQETFRRSNEYQFQQGQKLFESRKSMYDAYPFFSEADKKFRFTRDYVLKTDEYNSLMDSMMQRGNLSNREIARKVFMKVDHLADLLKRGHKLGLHSNTHPTKISNLSFQEQKAEYFENLSFFSRSLQYTPSMMAHPCGDYNGDTISILNDLGVRIGFLAELKSHLSLSSLEIPREDHTNILKQMEVVI